MFEKPPFEVLQKSLADPANPIGMRMRAAYYLRQAHADDESQQEDVVKALASGLLDERQGSLMRHEFAYVMGQIRDKRCCDTLEKVLAKEDDCIMVRHEAAEALGAIGESRSEAVLRQVKEANPDSPELSDTCQLALNFMEWRAAGGDPADMPAACACMLNPYSSVDPAPAHPAHADKSLAELGDILCDSDQAIFERYRAMFSLRNLGGEVAVQQLCRALTKDTSSALLRHEVAYVLGQMQHPSSVEALEESLRRPDEHKMVRHESAEALGAIDGRWEDVERILRDFTQDEDQVVRESCLVALDAADYWGHSSEGKDEDETAAQDQDSDVPLSFARQKNEPPLVNHFNVE
jgi:deoxyhypusine monooxygenase